MLRNYVWGTKEIVGLIENRGQEKTTENSRPLPNFPPKPQTPTLPPYSLRNAIDFTPEISKRFRQRRFLHATLSSSSTM